MSTDLAALRAALADPADVCTRLGIRLGKRTTRGYTVRCPSPQHPDRTPSCSVRVGQDGTLQWRCHACGARGDVFNLVAVVRGIDIESDFPAVVAAAQELAGIAASAPQKPDVPPEPRRLSPIEFDRVAGTLAALGALEDRPAADVAGYLEARGLLEQAKRDGWFALPERRLQPEWCRMLVDFTESDGAPFSREQLALSGLLYERLDAFRHPDNRLCIPWRDPHGRIATLQRRRVEPGGSEAQKYVFPPGPLPRFPYGIERDIPHAPVVWCEGAVDVLARRELDDRAGLRRLVLGVPGVSNWRKEWGALARDREVMLASDADKAGDAATGRWAADCFAAGAALVKRLRPVGVSDWGAELEEQMRKAVA